MSLRMFFLNLAFVLVCLAATGLGLWGIGWTLGTTGAFFRDLYLSWGMEHRVDAAILSFFTHAAIGIVTAIAVAFTADGLNLWTGKTCKKKTQ